MLNYKEKYDNLIDRGYLIDFYEEERDYKVTGKYHAFCVPIKKKDKVELNHYSKGSYEKALIVALSLWKLEIKSNLSNSKFQGIGYSV